MRNGGAVADPSDIDIVGEVYKSTDIHSEIIGQASISEAEMRADVDELEAKCNNEFEQIESLSPTGEAS